MMSSELPDQTDYLDLSSLNAQAKSSSHSCRETTKGEMRESLEIRACSCRQTFRCLSKLSFLCVERCALRFDDAQTERCRAFL